MNKYQGHRNKGNDPQLKKLLIFLTNSPVQNLKNYTETSMEIY